MNPALQFGAIEATIVPYQKEAHRHLGITLLSLRYTNTNSTKILVVALQ
jgi:hypothetical protein